MSAAGMRLRALIRKEFVQIRRDASSLALAFLMPLLLLLLFGYGVSLDAERVPVALVVAQPGPDTSSFIAAFRDSRYFRPVILSNMHKATDAMMRQTIDAIVVLRSDFARRLRRPGGAPIQLIVNGIDSNKAHLVIGYVDGVWGKWLEHLAAERPGAVSAPVTVEQRMWFNSEARSRNFLVPGLIAVIMTLIGALLTAMVIAREWERGTMESLLVTPVKIFEVIAGKLIPYFILGMGGLALSVAMAVWVFGVPLVGSLWILFASSALFLLAALAMGLFISTVAKSQFVAGQIALIATFLPAFLLSGFIFDIGSMPAVVRAVTHIVAARYYVSILQTLFLAGDEWRIILPNALALAVLAALFLGFSLGRARKRLE